MKKLVFSLAILVTLAVSSVSMAGTWNYSWKTQWHASDGEIKWTEHTYFDVSDEATCKPGSGSSSCVMYDIWFNSFKTDGMKFFIRTSDDKFESIKWTVDGWPVACEDANSAEEGREIENNVFQYYCHDEVHFNWNVTTNKEVAHVTYKYKNGVQRERAYYLPNVTN